jgi:hypothetical protein
MQNSRCDEEGCNVEGERGGGRWGKRGLDRDRNMEEVKNMRAEGADEARGAKS